MKYDLEIRYILIGDSYVGKSCIMEQYVDRYFSLSPPRTIGVDFNSKHTTYDISGNTYNVNNHIFDTSGDIKILPLFKSYITKAKCILLVFDLTDIGSFNNLKNWHTHINKEFKASRKINNFILIGNKKNSRKKQIDRNIVLNYANKLDINYIEISARSKRDVDHLFNKLNTDLIAEFSVLSPERQFQSPIIKRLDRPNVNPEKDTKCCFKICGVS